MSSHLDHILSYAPEAAQGVMLDLGSGRGTFLIEAARRGLRIEGLEPSDEYIRITEERSREAGVRVQVKKGVAESLPYPNEAFDFVNINEVIEHTEDPDRLLNEVRRVLKPGGKAYLSVPNRFGFKDQHFHLYGVNWLPRSWADAFISVFGSHKNYTNTSAGRQRLSDMHYYTFGSIMRAARAAKLDATDIRRARLQKEFSPFARIFLLPLYFAARAMYFDAFHLLLEKRDSLP